MENFLKITQTLNFKEDGLRNDRKKYSIIYADP